MLPRVALLLLTAVGLAAFRPMAITLEGRVRDQVTGAPLPGASIVLEPSQRSVVTDEEGRFSFGSFEITAPATLAFFHSGYQVVRIPLGSPGGGAWILDIAVARAAARVGDVRPAGAPR